MTNTTYLLSTPDHDYAFLPVQATDRVLVISQSKQAVEDFISTVELAGPEEGQELPEMVIEDMEDIDIHEPAYFTEVSRATLSLFLDFEVRYYMGAPAL